MKFIKIPFFALFIFAQLFFIFFKIYQQSNLIKLSYAKQKLEEERGLLLEQKKELHQTLLKLNNRSNIKKDASARFGLEKIRLSNLKKINDQPT
jgi:hypothetical protein